ncbi:MAG: hypothetical protein E7111_04485 [Bacteroidales bacterium]|nr:hypothetical protein [Bacteroidales bacterium]
MKAKRFWTALAVSACLSAGCSDLDEYKNKVDELDGRVTALETVTTNLNKNIVTIQTLYGGTTINSATKDANNVWTIVLSNGETLTLTQGSIGEGKAPVMSVDADGYWMVDYDGAGGNAPEYIMNGENKVLALGTDGVTPKFGVDADKYWTVSYDGGATYIRVLDADGQPVSALPDGEIQDPYFADVKLEGDQFKVILRTGEELVIPVVSSFLCAIESVGVQQFNAGESKPYNVTVKGVKSTMITAPQGWTAVLGEPDEEKAVLTVTAPVPTKAAIADSRADICILAFSTQGLATIAKMQVSCSDTPVVITPVASVTPGEATQSTLAYSVAVSDVTSWMYIHQLATEPAPDAAKIAADGVAGSETSLVFEGLDPSTEYTLYVLPVNGEQQGAVVSGKNTTSEKVYTNMYDKYMDGLDITVGGKTINKATYGDATLIENSSENKTLSTKGVYFVKSDAENVAVQNAEQLIIISYDNNIAAVSKSGQFAVVSSTGDDYLIMQNIKYTTGMTSGNMLGGSKVDDAFETIILDKCKFEVPTDMNFMYAQLPINEFVMVDCDIKVHKSSNAKYILQTNTTSTYTSVVFRNNIFYCTDGNAIYLPFSNANATITSADFSYNTFASVYPKGGSNGSYIIAKLFTSATATRNLFYVPDYTTLTTDKYSAILESPNTAGQDISITFNLVQYGETVPTKKIKPHFNLSISDKIVAPYGKKTSDGEPFSTKDFANGIFVPAETYASYGAQR